MLRTKHARALWVIVAAVVIAVPAWVSASSSTAQTPTAPQLNAPPLFATAGQSRTVAAIAGGNPITVRLMVKAPQSTTHVPVVMHRTEGDTWEGAIPSNLVRAPAVDYSVTSTFTTTSLQSDTARLVVLGTIRQTKPLVTSTGGASIANLALGGPAGLGVRGGNESARELPPSFAIDTMRNKLVVLDAVNARLVSVGLHNGSVAKLPLANGSTTASDVVIDASGTAYVLDQTNDTLIKVSNGSQTVVSAIGATGILGSRLAQDSATQTTYFRDVEQGAFLPLLDHGRRVSAADRRAKRRAGMPTKAGDLAAEVDGNTVVFGFAGADPRGFGVSFDDRVLDASDVVADDDGVVWSLIGVYQASTDSAAVHLVRLDPETGAARMISVGASVPGDVTRRLAPAGHGVVLLESNGAALDFVRFETL
jgi:hypothetical protein